MLPRCAIFSRALHSTAQLVAVCVEHKSISLLCSLPLMYLTSSTSQSGAEVWFWPACWVGVGVGVGGGGGRPSGGMNTSSPQRNQPMLR